MNVSAVLNVAQRTSAWKNGFAADSIRALIAHHLDVEISRVADGAHFIDDLGADWLDRLELMILIEEQFLAGEITGNDADQMEVVGDLIRYVEGMIVRDGCTAPTPVTP